MMGKPQSVWGGRCAHGVAPRTGLRAKVRSAGIGSVFVTTTSRATLSLSRCVAGSEKIACVAATPWWW